MSWSCLATAVAVGSVAVTETGTETVAVAEMVRRIAEVGLIRLDDASARCACVLVDGTRKKMDSALSQAWKSCEYTGAEGTDVAGTLSKTVDVSKLDHTKDLRQRIDDRM